MRVLFLTQRLPYAPNRGDRVRAYQLLRNIRAFADVDLLSFVHDDEEASHLKEAEGLASTVTMVRVPRLLNTVRSVLALPSGRPTTHTMLDAPGVTRQIEAIVGAHPPSVVLAYCSGMARLALEPPLNGVPLVLDMVDVDSAKWAALAEVAAPPKSWIYRREARLLARFEAKATRHAFATIITTDKERDALLALAPGTRIDVVQNGVDAGGLRPPGPPAESSTVVFCGVMNYAPNVEGAIWMARSVWPLVRRRRPEARLLLVGSSPTQAVRGLASPGDGIEVTGHVADIRDYLWKAAVAAAPLLTARGIQNKVLEAAAAGLPVVATPLVMEGVPPEVRPACQTADGAAAFAEAVVNWLERSPAERRARALLADVNALSWDRRLGGIQELLATAERSSLPHLPRRLP